MSSFLNLILHHLFYTLILCPLSLPQMDVWLLGERKGFKRAGWSQPPSLLQDVRDFFCARKKLEILIFSYPVSIPLRDEMAASSARMSTTTFPGQAHLVQVVCVWKMRRVSGVNSNQRSHAAPGSWWQATLDTERVHTMRLSTRFHESFHKRKFSIKKAKRVSKHSWQHVHKFIWNLKACLQS